MSPSVDFDAELVTEVAERTRQCEIKIWGFGVGGALSGLVRAGTVLDRSDLIDDVVTRVKPSLAAAPDPTDHLIAVEALLGVSDMRPELDVTDACTRWKRAVVEASREATDGPRVHRPDLAQWSSTIWVDCMHTDGPGLVALGSSDEAVRYAAEYAGVLQRDDGLFHHGYDVATGRGNGVAWGRGQAWALLGLTDTAELDDDLHARLNDLVTALARHEDDGRWHTVVDDPSSPFETSVAAYVAHGVRRAVAKGLVPASHAAMCERAFHTTLDHLVDGGLTVSEATPVGDPANYYARAGGVFPWGQAPVLHAILDRLEDDASRRPSGMADEGGR